MDVFRIYGANVAVVVHAAAQPSRDWGGREPSTDFAVNALGTLNVLEATREFSPEASFIFTSSSEVYGDHPNALPLVELDTRYELEPTIASSAASSENMAIDACNHAVSGVSKLSADLMVQEYGRSFGLNTVCFRTGTVMGKAQSSTALHGFIAYAIRCAGTGDHYTVYGYKGKNVRDVIHASDLAGAFIEFVKHPRAGEIYNLGGGRRGQLFGHRGNRAGPGRYRKKMNWSYLSAMRAGDTIWWIGDNSKFESHYPGWKLTYDLDRSLKRCTR